MKMYKVINPIEFIEYCNLSNKGVVVDVRTVSEHDECRLKIEHENIPIDELNPTDFLKIHRLSKDIPIYFICHLGIRARRAARNFVEEGCSNIFVVNGGMDACINADLEIEGSAKTQTLPYMIGAFGFSKFCKLVPKDGIILDVRSAIEHEECQLKIEHENIPLNELNPGEFLKNHNLRKDIPICILSHSDLKSKEAAQKFVNEGCSAVFIVADGLNACIDAGYEVKEEPAFHKFK